MIEDSRLEDKTLPKQKTNNCSSVQAFIRSFVPQEDMVVLVGPAREKWLVTCECSSANES